MDEPKVKKQLKTSLIAPSNHHRQVSNAKFQRQSFKWTFLEAQLKAKWQSVFLLTPTFNTEQESHFCKMHAVFLYHAPLSPTADIRK